MTFVPASVHERVTRQAPTVSSSFSMFSTAQNAGQSAKRERRIYLFLKAGKNDGSF
jgi:hypothetical protein